MTLINLIREAHEKTHWPEMEILDVVRRAWPQHTQFTPTQAALLVHLIERKPEPRTLTQEQIWGEAGL